MIKLRAVFLMGLIPAFSIQAEVTYERLLHAEEDPGNWLTYSGQYHSQRFSKLDQINRENVHNLQVKWVRQLKTLATVETCPLVVDGVMYLTLPLNEVIAMDAKTGRSYWTYLHALPDRLTLCCGKVNRGLAMLDTTLYMGTLDARLVALDSKSGFIVWNVDMGDHLAGYSITAAPLAVKDMIISGIAGGEYGIRGFIDAYDAKTGERRWRTRTIPVPGEPGNDTWEGDSWKSGGAPSWMTGSFDPDLNLIYWGVGNPGPDWNGDVRKGDNLYSDCVLALDADTGEIRWHFQFTPHDVNDWDACQVPILVDAEYQGKPRKLMYWANRNAFYYLLDRETGEFLLARQYAKQTWADGIDANGRPLRRPDSFPTEDGTLIYPDYNGASNWWSQTYSPRTGLLYLMAFDGGATYYLGGAEYQPGEFFGGSFPDFDWDHVDPSFVSAVRALDPLTGERKWQYVVQAKSTSGLLSTAGDVLFGGTVQGNFFALDTVTGKELWRLDLGGKVHAAPISYLVDGKQYVTIAAGHAIFTFGLGDE